MSSGTENMKSSSVEGAGVRPSEEVLALAGEVRYIDEMTSHLLTLFASSFVVALSGALMPGPLLTVTVSESARRGVLTGPAMIVGHSILELLLVVALVSGLAPYFMRDDVFIGISLAGGVVLLWMACSMIRELPTLRLHTQENCAAGRNLIISGIVLSAVNPYWLIWWATIGLGYIVYSLQYGAAGLVSFFAGHILADLAWYGCVSYGVVRGGHFLSETGYRRLIGGCALFLAVFALYFFYSGVERLV